MSFSIASTAWVLLLLCSQLSVSQSIGASNNDTILPRKPRFPDVKTIFLSINPGQPPRNKALFWTGLSADANTRKGQTDAIFDYDEKYKLVPYDGEGVWKTPQFFDVDLYESTDQQQACDFGAAVYATFAYNTKGDVYLIMPDGAAPTAESNFWRIEWMYFQQSGNVDRIFWIDMNLWNSPQGFPDPATVTKLWWKKGDPQPATYPGMPSPPGSSSSSSSTTSSTTSAASATKKPTCKPKPLAPGFFNKLKAKASSAATSTTTTMATSTTASKAT